MHRLMRVAPPPGRDVGAIAIHQHLQRIVQRETGNIGTAFLDGGRSDIAPGRGALDIAVDPFDKDRLQRLVFAGQRTEIVLDEPLLQRPHPGGVDQGFGQMLVHLAIPRRQQPKRLLAPRLDAAGLGGL